MHAIPACMEKTHQNNINFEKELKNHFGVKHCFLTSSGKASLVLILKALKEIYPDRNEVLIPAFTCFSVPAAIKKCGLTIRLCDLSFESLDFDKKKLKEILSVEKKRKKILCIVATHLYGCPADVPSIKDIAGQDIPIVEDAAQAMGEALGKEKVGTIGDIGFFSLGRGKALSTMEGGVIITSRSDLGIKIGALVETLPGYSPFSAAIFAMKTFLANVLIHPLLFWLPKSLPFLKLGETIYDTNFKVKKISAFQRKLAKHWQIRLKTHRNARISNIRLGLSLIEFKYRPLCTCGLDVGLIRLPFLALTNDERNKLLEISEQNGLGIMPGYPTPISEIPEIADEFSKQQFLNAKDLSNRLFSIPIHQFVSNNDIKRISTVFDDMAMLNTQNI